MTGFPLRASFIPGPIDVPVHMLQRGGKHKREVDIASRIHILALRRLTHAFVEQVGARSGQGVSGVFAFGKCCGIILGVLAARNVPVTLVSGPLETGSRRAQSEGRGAGPRFAIAAAGCPPMAVAEA